ncbi:hypothetical protein P8452_62833 [Trifolium repens]|nr:hypothetical protein P8452_62833 [Trifolium repens]
MFNENTELWKKRVAYYKTLDYQLAEPGRFRNLLDMNAYLGENSQDFEVKKVELIYKWLNSEAATKLVETIYQS